MEGCHVSKPRCLDFLVELLDILDQHNLTRFPKQAESVLRWKCGAEKCGTCAVVGNAWHLVGSSFGEEIDKNDLVIRFGGAVEHGDGARARWQGKAHECWQLVLRAMWEQEVTSGLSIIQRLPDAESRMGRGSCTC